MDFCPGLDKNKFHLRLFVSIPTYSSSFNLFTCVEMPVILPCGLGSGSSEMSRKGKVRLMYPNSLSLVALHSQEGIARVFSIYEAGWKKCQFAWHVAWILVIIVCLFTNKEWQEISFLAWELCLYPVVRESAALMGWRLIGEDNDESAKQNCHVVWIDRAFKENTFLMYHTWQCINHFPGMVNICNKAPMVRYLDIMRRELLKAFSIPQITFYRRITKRSSCYSHPAVKARSCTLSSPPGGLRGRGSS